MDAKMELNYLYEAVPLLDRYLESKDAAWQLPGIAREPAYAFSQLTIGVVLFMLKRSKARELNEKQAAERDDYETRIFQSRIHNERAWMKKAGQDLGNRMRLWGGFLDGYHKDPQAMISTYPNQVSQRAILQSLWEEQDTGSLLIAPLQMMLQSLDAALKMIFEPGEFMWEPELVKGFPQDRYWFLYGSLKRK
jgi:hypothetical protein